MYEMVLQENLHYQIQRKISSSEHCNLTITFTDIKTKDKSKNIISLGEYSRQ